MVQAYMERFIREAVMRSSTNKSEVKLEHAGTDKNGTEIILSHEDLEKITGLLLLDM